MNIEIRKVASQKDLKKFIDFPFLLYSGNKFWCPPLRFDEISILDKRKNPAFEFCEAEYWMAYKDGKPVGRIAGIINPKANERWMEKLVRFGWIDFMDDPEISGTLIRTVEDWGREKGMTGIHGPLGFSDMDPEGMLIGGFDQMSNMSAIYNFPYYPVHMERLGFRKAVDWVQYDFTVPANVPEKIERMALLVAEKYNLRTLKAKRAKELQPYAGKVFQLLNKAFFDLYGFAPLSPKQVAIFIKQYFGFIRAEFVSIVLDSNDEIVAFGISLPSLTKAFQKAKGRLFPFGFLHILKAMKRNDTVTMYLVGVHPDYQAKGALSLVFRDLTQAYIDHGFKKAVTHPQLEANLKALAVWKNYEGKQNIRRRCWIKEIGGRKVRLSED